MFSEKNIFWLIISVKKEIDFCVRTLKSQFNFHKIVSLENVGQIDDFLWANFFLYRHVTEESFWHWFNTYSFVWYKIKFKKQSWGLVKFVIHFLPLNFGSIPYISLLHNHVLSMDVTNFFYNANETLGIYCKHCYVTFSM